MAQLPLIAIGRIPAVRRRKVLGNIVFWVGLFAGKSSASLWDFLSADPTYVRPPSSLRCVLRVLKNPSLAL